MKIGEDYKLEGDRVCLSLLRRRVAKKGKNKGNEEWNCIAYFNAGRFDHALERLIDLEISGCQDLEDVVRCCDNIKEWVRSALKDAGLIP